MKSKIAVLLILVLALVVSGCSRVETGFVAKKVSTAGIQPEIYEPGRIYYNPFTTKIYTIPTSSILRPANVRVIMADYNVAEDGEIEGTRRIGLEMDFIVNIRYSIREDDRIINAMLRDMDLSATGSRVDLRDVYQKYGNMVVGQVTREVLGEYTPEEVLNNLSEINALLFKRISEEMSDSPLKFSNVSLGPITLPKVITDRVNANKDTELSEAQARASQRIAMLEKQNEIELSRQQAVRERIDAQSMAEQNKILNESISPEVLELRRLQMREKEINMMEAFAGGNNSSIFIPYGAVENPGAQMRMFNQK